MGLGAGWGCWWYSSKGSLDLSTLLGPASDDALQPLKFEDTSSLSQPPNLVLAVVFRLLSSPSLLCSLWEVPSDDAARKEASIAIFRAKSLGASDGSLSFLPLEVDDEATGSCWLTGRISVDKPCMTACEGTPGTPPAPAICENGKKECKTSAVNIFVFKYPQKVVNVKVYYVVRLDDNLLKLPFNSMELFVASWFPMIFHWLVCTKLRSTSGAFSEEIFEF